MKYVTIMRTSFFLSNWVIKYWSKCYYSANFVNSYEYTRRSVLIWVNNIRFHKVIRS